MKKIIFIVMDGLGDSPVPELENKTPLEAARTPNMDSLLKSGQCGLLSPVHYNTLLPTSEEGHFSLFGYSADKYPVRRGFFTVLGAGIKMRKGDVALRGNFATVDDKMEVVDRRAGRIDDTFGLIKAVDGIKIDGVKFIVKYADGHRVGIVMRGKNLSSAISEGDPHYGKLETGLRRIEPLDETEEAKFTAHVLNKFLERSHQILKEHPFNKKRKEQGLLPGNYFLLRGVSSFIELPSFRKRYGLKACCIAGKNLYKQIGKSLGMKIIDVKGADGSVSTNLAGKFLFAKNALKKYDFVFVHIKATDTLAEDGRYKEKKEFIERIDENIKTMLGLKDVLIVITADHSTCCNLKRHCDELIPILISGTDSESISKFSEKDCKRGKLGILKQTDLMAKVLELYKK
jgi:2,3-bisphosphoglycerate-independent phosphoglycerate mutase